MDINRIIIYIMVFFVLVGAADQITGSRLRLGNKFEDGIMAMGTLVISTAGLLVLAPLLGSVLRPVVGPAFALIGADPGVFGGMILDLDTGGAALVRQLAEFVVYIAIVFYLTTYVFRNMDVTPRGRLHPRKSK